jgi:hypothetical protein
MNMLPFPTMKPAFPCAPGATWSWQGTRVTRQVFRVSGTYTPPPGLVSCDVECIGGGGGGGAVGATTSVQQLLSAGGGGSGGRSIIALPAPIVAGGVSVIVGAGGFGGALGPPPGTGDDGGATSFGALCIANGGGGGGAFEIGLSGGAAGVEALPGVGDMAFPGACGEAGFFNNFTTTMSMSQQGARGGWIYGGTAATQAQTGGYAPGANAYPNTGAGGGGAIINQMGAGSTTNGGNGGSGVCIVTEYCVSTGNMDGCGCGCGCARVPAWGGWRCD